MAKKDMYSNLVIDTFTSGAAIDLLGFNSHTFAAVRSAAGAISFKVEESDDNATFVDVTATKVLGATSVASAKTAQIGYKGDCRYVKVTVTADSATLVHVAAAPLIAPAM
jgi:hypothetical protein